MQKKTTGDGVVQAKEELKDLSAMTMAKAWRQPTLRQREEEGGMETGETLGHRGMIYRR